MQKDVLIKKVSEILWANESRLSDGYEFYEGGYPEAVKAVDEISEQIVDLLTQRTGDGLESEQICMCDIQGSSNCDIHGANRRA